MDSSAPSIQQSRIRIPCIYHANRHFYYHLNRTWKRRKLRKRTPCRTVVNVKLFQKMLKSKILFQKFEQWSLMRIRIPLLFLLAAAVVAARKTIKISRRTLFNRWNASTGWPTTLSLKSITSTSCNKPNTFRFWCSWIDSRAVYATVSKEQLNGFEPSDGKNIRELEQRKKGQIKVERPKSYSNNAFSSKSQSDNKKSVNALASIITTQRYNEIFFLIFLQSVWPDWAIFNTDCQQNFLQKFVAQVFGNFWSYSEKCDF